MCSSHQLRGGMEEKSGKGPLDFENNNARLAKWQKRRRFPLYFRWADKNVQNASKVYQLLLTSQTFFCS